MQTGSEPERARQKHSFRSWQPVPVFFFRTITKHKTVLHQLALDRFDRSAHSLVSERQESSKRQREQTGIERIRSVVLGKSLLVRAESARANLGMNLVANLPPSSDSVGGVASRFLHEFMGSVERVPRHPFGM